MTGNKKTGKKRVSINVKQVSDGGWVIKVEGLPVKKIMNKVKAYAHAEKLRSQRNKLGLIVKK